ncbi:hypothetical protein HDU89_008945 [Geranomyces variabilis]|nr:hypothetical protein HDU89_008945 [Geranomyces variabilis]
MTTRNLDMNATQLNIHKRPSAFSASADENVVIERRLEEGTCSPLASLRQAREHESIVTWQQRHPVLNQFIQLAGWLIVFTGSAILSHEVRVDGFSPAWLPTGILAAALIKSTVRMNLYLSLLLFPVMVGTACLKYPLPVAVYVWAILYISAALLATTLKCVCPEVVSGFDTMSSCITFLAVAPVLAFLEALGFARALGAMPEYFETNFIILALRLFISSLAGTLLVMPFFLWLNEARFRDASCQLLKREFVRPTCVLLLCFAAMVGLPLAFIRVPDVVYGSTMYFMLPVAVVAVFTAGIPGMSTAIALGFTSVAFVSVRYRQVYEISNVEAVLHLQLWTIALVCATLLFTAAVRELHVCQHDLHNLKHGINGSAKKSVKHASLCVVGESPYILRYVCRQLKKPLQQILRDCRSITADARGKNPSHEPDLIQHFAEVAGRSINRIAEFMLPLIADASRLARIADGRDDHVLTSLDLPVFLEELSAQLRVELAAADIETRFDLPNKLEAKVDKERVTRIFRAMVMDACRVASFFQLKTADGHVCIQAIASSPATRFVKCDDYVDLDITVTVTGWVLEEHNTDLLLRPYMPKTDLSTKDANRSGTGLALAVASKLAWSMNGRLIVFGQLGYGTIFDCRLPTKIENGTNNEFFPKLRKRWDETSIELGVAAKAPLLKQLPNDPNSAADLTTTITKRLPAAQLRRRSKDSDPSWESDQHNQTATGQTGDFVELSSRFLLRGMLQQYPELRIDEASDGVEAFEASLSIPYSLILMDLNMGKMDGHVTNIECAETFRRFGLDDLLIKPITKENLAAVLLKFKIIHTGHLSLPPEANGQSIPSQSIKPVQATTSPLVETGSQIGSIMTSSASVEPLNFYPSRGAGRLDSSLNRQRPRALAQLAPILIVDDNPVSRRILLEHLRQVIPSREVVQASDGTEAVALCSAGQKFAIIYMDLAMPGMDGDVAAMRIRNMRVIGGGPPIIAVTGLVLDGESFQGLRASGINDAIEKPVCDESLIATLQSFGILDSVSRTVFAETSAAPKIVRRSTDPGSSGDIRGHSMMEGARSTYKQHVTRTRTSSKNSDEQGRRSSMPAKLNASQLAIASTIAHGARRL